MIKKVNIYILLFEISSTLNTVAYAPFAILSIILYFLFIKFNDDTVDEDSLSWKKWKIYNNFLIISLFYLHFVSSRIFSLLNYYFLNKHMG